MWSKNSDKRDTLFPRSEDAVFAGPYTPPASVGKITGSISDIAESSREPLQAAEEQVWKEEPGRRFSSSISLSRGEPWSKYQRFMVEEQAGRKTVAYSNNITFDLVAIREWKLLFGDTLDRLRKTSHPNIVNLEEVYQSEETLFLVYEDMDASHVTLKDIEDNPSEPLNEFEIASLCKQVLNGLLFIHNELQVNHDNISGANVLLTRTGDVKIANVAEAMLRNDPGKQSDVRALGAMVSRLMMGDRWGPQIHEFLELAKSATADALSKHIFLDFSPGPGCLVPHVRVAAMNRVSIWGLGD